MRVRMLRGTGGPDGLACEVGGVYDLPDPVAAQFVANGRAVVVVSDDVPPAPIEVQDRQLKPTKRR